MFYQSKLYTPTLSYLDMILAFIYFWHMLRYQLTCSIGKCHKQMMKKHSGVPGDPSGEKPMLHGLRDSVLYREDVAFMLSPGVPSKGSAQLQAFTTSKCWTTFLQIWIHEWLDELTTTKTCQGCHSSCIGRTGETTTCQMSWFSEISVRV